ncbi:MAG: CPBP family intramembrane metalloprotease [Gemmatimonadetes bacterium]|nr:CPBP family intramembrane metalloprotease [Gemmatimonadota bacterium]
MTTRLRQDPAPEGRPLPALLLFLAAVFGLGALLAPWLYLGAQALAAAYPGARDLARFPFGTYVNRGLLIVALAALPLYLRGAGVRRWSDVGLDPRRVLWRRWAAGFALGFVSLAVVCAVSLAAGGRVFDFAHVGKLPGRLLGALGTAVLVGVIEELLFRGAIFGTLRRAIAWPAALLASSAIYAIVHFLAKPAPPARVEWSTGLTELPGMLRGFVDVHTVIPALLSLTLAGTVLGLAYRETGDLWTSIGIHGGWIFWLKSYGYLTRPAPGANEWLWGTNKLIDGWFAFGMLVVVLAVVLIGSRSGRIQAPG